jgi:hypothetical protein
MYVKLCLALFLVCGSLGLLGVQTAHAEKHWFYTENGYGCEMTTSGELAKGVCREIAHPETSWYVVYIEFNTDLDRVFIDTYSPSAFPEIMYVERREMSTQEFRSKYG